ncbi:50S ribosomal protein L33 [Candidatus Woesebacteria bacterium]|nr:50S ribosomal protein L33 [Candidatus Woesebacteria bacterium]
MAKGKKARANVGLICSECKKQNYVTERNKLNTQEALVLQKFCSNCHKKTKHTEKKKLH